jgi:hypothetical protein
VNDENDEIVHRRNKGTPRKSNNREGYPRERESDVSRLSHQARGSKQTFVGCASEWSAS